MPGSCLVEKIGYHIPLAPGDAALLARLEEARETWRAHAIVRDIGAQAERLYVVRGGWFFSYTMLPDGGRQILHIHYPCLLYTSRCV